MKCKSERGRAKQIMIGQKKMSKIKWNCVCICGNITVDRLGKVEDIDMALSRKKSIFRYNVQEVWDEFLFLKGIYRARKNNLKSAHL